MWVDFLFQIASKSFRVLDTASVCLCNDCVCANLYDGIICLSPPLELMAWACAHYNGWG